MKLEKRGELESTQSAPLAALMTDLKGSDIPNSSAVSRADTRLMSDGSSDELHAAKQSLPRGHHKLPPKGLSKGQMRCTKQSEKRDNGKVTKARKNDCFQPLPLSTRAVLQLLHFLVKHIHEHSQRGHKIANISQ